MKLILIFLSILFCSFSAQAQNQKATPLLVFSDSYVPMSWKSDEGLQGILVDVIKNTLSDVPIRFEGYPWARAQVLVKRDDADGFITIPTPARLKYVKCSDEPVINVSIGIYTYENHPRMNELLKVKSYNDLKGFLISDYVGNGWAKKKFSRLNVTWAKTIEQTYKMLINKRADVLIRNQFNFGYFSQNLKGADKISKLPTSLSDVKFHLCIRKNSKHLNLLKTFDVAMQRLRQSGKYIEILKRYNSAL